MSFQETVFAQLIQTVDHHEFERCVKRYNGNYRSRSLSCWDLFLSLLFAQWAEKRSMSSTVFALTRMQQKLYHMGFRGRITTSAISDAAQRACSTRLSSLKKLNKPYFITFQPLMLEWHYSGTAIRVNKEALIQAVLELERQETLQSLALTVYAEQLAAIAEGMEQLFVENEVIRAKGALLELFLTDEECSLLIPDTLLDEWKAEFENRTNSPLPTFCLPKFRR